MASDGAAVALRAGILHSPEWRHPRGRSRILFVERLSFDGQQWSSLALDTSWFTVESLLDLPNGDIVASGNFWRVGEAGARRIARWNGAQWVPFGTGLNGRVRAATVLASGERVLGGDFTVAGGAPANRVVRWDGISFLPLGAGLDAEVETLVALANGDVVAGGYFQHAGSVQVDGIARFDGTSWSSLGTSTGASNSVLAAVELVSGDLVAAGTFSSMGGVSATNVARWDGLAWSALGNGLPGGTVLALAVLPDGSLVAGGNFETYSGAPADYIARWDGTRWSALGSAIGGTVFVARVLPDGDLLVASDWIRLGAQPGPGLARWDGTRWHAVRTDLDDVDAIAVRSDGRVLVGGSFLMLGGQPSAYFAEATPTCPALATPFGAPCIGPAGVLTLTADRLPWIGATFRATAMPFAPNSVGLSMLGYSSPGVPLTTYLPVGVPGCLHLASTEAVRLLVPQAGAASFELAIPENAGFVGLSLFHQIVQLGVDAQGQPTSLSGTNGLALTVGVW